MRLKAIDTTEVPEGATWKRLEIHLITDDDEIPVLDLLIDEDRKTVEVQILDTLRVPCIYLQ